MASRLSWSEFFIAITKVCALKSKDPHTQVGACLVNHRNQIISTGFNGFPRGLIDDDYPWARAGNALTVKYSYVVHAELNAIITARCDLTGLVLYTTLFPCAACAKVIVQTGIKTVYYLYDTYIHEYDGQAAVKMLQDAKVKYIQLPDVKINVKDYQF